MEIISSPINSQNNEKVGKVLKKFLDPNFKVRNDVYLNLFLTHLVGKGDDCKNITNEDTKEQFVQWLIEATKLWDKKQGCPPSIILAFTLNLASRLSVDEQVFVKLNCQNVYESLVGIAKTNLKNDASVTLGLVTLLCSFLEHKSGVQWVLATTVWIDVVNFGREAHTMYIRKKAYQFVAKLLEKTICFNRSFCLNLVAMLLKPLEDSLKTLPNSDAVQPTSIENRELFESLKPHLIFISEVMEILIKGGHTAVLEVFRELKTGTVTKKLLLLSQIEDFSFELIKIKCVSLFSKLGKESVCKPGVVRQIAQDSITLSDIKAMFDVIQNEMNRDHVRCVIKICHYAHKLYCSLAGKLPLCIRKGEPIEFENQMVLLQIVPILTFFSVKRGIGIEVMLSDVFRREFYQKLIKMSAIRTLEICFRWKERLKFKPNLIEDMTFGLQYMLKAKKLLNKERAAMFFQPLVYFLKDILMLIESGFICEMDKSCDTFLYTLIETIIDLVQSFDLTWRESIETISVLSIACQFLQYNHWEGKIVISGLRLLNLAISKYMSPDMVLLMDNSKESAVSQTGSLLYAKCHDSSWEIRDTALENVYTLSLNANSSFPSYTNILLDAKLPQLVVEMALKDGEYYVRATAFRCLHELIQIEEVWDALLAIDGFLDKILNVFENETEGVVRKEAATLIVKIGKHQSFPQDKLPWVYDVMTHAVVGDLHWEVKCNALDFWFNVFRIHLMHQGMIDRGFPAVTFSIEQRKIVTLNEAEVRKRLIKVLNQMSHIGSLYVFKCACLDDCDVEVSRKAIDALYKIVKILKKYNVPCENIDMKEPPSPCVVSPASSTTWTASSPDQTNGASPQFSSSLFDPFSPLPIPPSPSLNLDLDQYSFSPPSNSSSTSSSHSCIQHSQQGSSIFASPTVSQSGALFDSGNDITNEMDYMVSDGENMETTLSFDPVRADSILDELLNSNDMAFLQQIYKPSDQVKNTTSKMKKTTYMSPSEFVKFVYHEAETNVTQRTQWLDSLDEFDSLLDDILKEYNVVPDVNNMDCY